MLSCPWYDAYKRTLAATLKKKSIPISQRHITVKIELLNAASLNKHFLPISSKAFYMHHLSDRIAHTRTCYTSSGALAGTRNSLWSTVRDRSDDPSHHERTLYDRNNVLPVPPPPSYRASVQLSWKLILY